MAFSDNLKNIREKKGMSQYKLAKKVGISQRAVYSYEKGTRVPNVLLACCIATVLDTTVEMLVNSEDKSKVKPTGRRFIIKKAENKKAFEELLVNKNLSRKDLMLILNFEELLANKKLSQEDLILILSTVGINQTINSNTDSI